MTSFNDEEAGYYLQDVLPTGSTVSPIQQVLNALAIRALTEYPDEPMDPRLLKNIYIESDVRLGYLEALLHPAQYVLLHAWESKLINFAAINVEELERVSSLSGGIKSSYEKIHRANNFLQILLGERTHELIQHLSGLERAGSNLGLAEVKSKAIKMPSLAQLSAYTRFIGLIQARTLQGLMKFEDAEKDIIAIQKKIHSLIDPLEDSITFLLNLESAFVKQFPGFENAETIEDLINEELLTNYIAQKIESAYSEETAVSRRTILLSFIKEFAISEERLIRKCKQIINKRFENGADIVEEKYEIQYVRRKVDDLHSKPGSGAKELAYYIVRPPTDEEIAIIELKEQARLAIKELSAPFEIMIIEEDGEILNLELEILKLQINSLKLLIDQMNRLSDKNSPYNLVHEAQSISNLIGESLHNLSISIKEGDLSYSELNSAINKITRYILPTQREIVVYRAITLLLNLESLDTTNLGIDIEFIQGCLKETPHIDLIPDEKIRKHIPEEYIQMILNYPEFASKLVELYEKVILPLRKIGVSDHNIPALAFCFDSTQIPNNASLNEAELLELFKSRFIAIHGK